MKPYLDLTKPRITWLILMSTGIGFFFGLRQFDAWVLFHTLVGTALIASGTAALNQWYERDADGKMHRTRLRPLPSGQVGARQAFWFGVSLSIAGFVELTFGANPLTGALGLFTLATYLFIYTPLKQRSPHSTTIGAIPGAMPPMIGFAAAAGELTIQAWILFGILFLWQFPHFYAIAWMYRDDYARAGIRMLPVVEPDGQSTARRMVWLTAVLIPFSLLPSVFSMTGWAYLLAAGALGIYFLRACIRVQDDRTAPAARRVLLASVTYLPLLYVAMLSGCVTSPARELPDYYAIPEFTLTDSTGRAMHSSELAGNVWVADFVFTRCTTHCPRISSIVSRLTADVSDLRAVTFTVDPETDTPAVLADYAKRYQADTSRWLFLTGSRDVVKSIREEAFKLGEMGSPLNHSTRIVLVDQKGRIRGFYDSNEPGIVDRLKSDIRLLAAR
jgi:protoheme IX farnesyltransferase